MTLEGGKIARVGFAPSFADDNGRPQFISADHERFVEIVEDLRTISKAAGLTTTFTVEGDEVFVSTHS